MGSGSWSASTYASATRSKIDSGTTFGYSRTMDATGFTDRRAHDELDPKRAAGAASPLAGKTVRESRDSADHPNSVPVAVWFDETGSMGAVPRVLQTKLTGLFGLLLRRGYVEDPQILVGAYGDVACDAVPLQVSQFESDNRVDDALDKVYLEGGGGGNFHESMALAWYYMAHHTATDAREKRGKRGYAFFIGDETTVDLTAEQVRKFVGVEEPAGDLTVEGLARAVQEDWDVYVLVVQTGAAAMQRSNEFYTRLFGDHAVPLQDPGAVAETIGLLIGVAEGTVDSLTDGLDDLRAIGSDGAAIAAAGQAVARVAAGRGTRQLGQVVRSDAASDLDSSDSATRI